MNNWRRGKCKPAGAGSNPRAPLLLLLLWAPLCLAAAAAAGGPDQGKPYMRAEFGEIVAKPELYKDKQVCIRAGLIRHGLLVDVSKLNKPYSCSYSAPEFDPEAIEEAARLCIRRYGRHIHPGIEVWDYPENTGIEPEACVIACGALTIHDPAGIAQSFSLNAETIHPCKQVPGK